MPGLSHSRSDKVICCSFPTLEAIKFVHWVNRFERPLPSNSFQVHHYLLSFSTARVSLHHRHGSVSADVSAVSWSASAGVASTALIFSTSVSPPFSPAVADSKLGDGALAMLSAPWAFAQLAVPTSGPFLAREATGFHLHCACTGADCSRSQGLVLQRATGRSLSPEVQPCCWAGSNVQGVLSEPTSQSIGQESSDVLLAALCWGHWTMKLMLCEI